MPLEQNREGDTCDKCQKSNVAGKITNYTDPHDGYEGILCSECIEKREKPYTEICPKCKRLAYKHGGLTFYDDSDADDIEPITTENFDELYDEEPSIHPELMCIECHTKKVEKVKKYRKIKLTIKNFIKDYWQFWVMAIIGILGIIGLSKFWT